MKKEKVIRLVFHRNDIDEITDDLGCTLSVESLIEYLRYAGIITVHRDNSTGICFDLHTPKGMDNETWVNQNVERIKSFGVNAAYGFKTE